MTAEHLLQAMGLLDDDMIAQAEGPLPRGNGGWRRWAALAACLAVAVALGYSLRHLPIGMSGGAAEPSAGGCENAASSAADQGAPEGSQAACVVIGGVRYLSTGQLLAAEMAPEDVQTAGAYTAHPEEDGQQNIDPAGADYAWTDQGLAVLVEGEWTLFAPAA